MKRQHKAQSGLDLKSDDGAPPWLNVMRAITGLTETPGEADNEKIIGMARYLGKKFSEQKSYWDQYQHDSTAWCGLTMAFCMGAATPDGISGPWGPTDTDRGMWALAWADSEDYAPLDEPVLGAVVVMEREGGGHVTCLEGVNSDGTYRCRGGNQSDAVNVQNYSRSQVVALVWPKAYGDVPRRSLSEGDSGSDVEELQQRLGLAPADCDGDYGPTTEAAVRGFQRGWALDPDGEVGPATWAALDELQNKVMGERLSASLITDISDRAARSAIAKYPWEGRGVTPMGYAKGMALAWAIAVTDLSAGEDWADVMAAGASGDPDSDVLSYYKDHLRELDWDCSRASIDTMRALWCILWALGPRESSGNHFCGRDQSADNTDADTCEAGAWQWSWNLATSSDTIGDLMDEYWADPSSFLEQWNEDGNTDAGNIENYGSGTGARSQWLSKYCPVFSALVTAVGLRKRRNHWGPINRDELDWEGVEICDELLTQVQSIMEGVDPTPIPPDPPEEVATVSIQITASGPVTVVVNGTDISDL
jgi:uncharacterized protein (TIGR02594 family)